jgi:hypothetical protein
VWVVHDETTDKQSTNLMEFYQGIFFPQKNPIH